MDAEAGHISIYISLYIIIATLVIILKLFAIKKHISLMAENKLCVYFLTSD